MKCSIKRSKRSESLQSLSVCKDYIVIRFGQIIFEKRFNFQGTKKKDLEKGTLILQIKKDLEKGTLILDIRKSKGLRKRLFIVEYIKDLDKIDSLRKFLDISARK